MINGFINIYKTSGLSSNKALSILKYRLKQNNIITKVGHFGTLDPIAEGVLPVALGRAARLFDYSLDKKKTYVATFVFGAETDTLDRTGTIIREGRKEVTAREIESVISSLTGKVLQVPPLYSAKSIGGVRAYKLARQGETFDLPPKQVEIHSIKILEEVSVGVFKFEIECGGGTYIRSIARDMANKLGTVAYMDSLVRTASGGFYIENAVKVDDIDDPKKFIMPLSTFTDAFYRYDLTEKEYSTVKNGVPTQISAEYEGNIAVYYDDELLGIGKLNDGKLMIKTWLI